MAKSSASAFLLCFLVLSSQISLAQDFDHGLNLYQQGEFTEAIEIFEDIDTPDATLFLSKSYLGLGQYVKAKSYLHKIDDSGSSDEFRAEVQYTLSLTEFQLKKFGSALNRLHALTQSDVSTEVNREASELYDGILNYLTLDQRRNAFQEANSDQVKVDIISSAVGKVENSVVKLLYDQLKQSVADSTTINLEQLSRRIPDPQRLEVVRNFNEQLEAPDGIIYNIGVALPSYSSDHTDYAVTQGLYFGYVMAAEKFNSEHSEKKAFIRYQNTAANSDSAGYAMTNFAWSYNVDAVLGPLFSEPAGKLALLAEEYQIPMIAPLANSDTLNFDNPYLYQANPTFSSHGRRMAQYAVNTLEMDTIAVITERNSRGATSAYAFREEAEKLGASVPHFFVEDFQSLGYELTDYTKFFGNDKAKIDTMENYHQLDGIYAPFTGQAASNLIDLLLVDLEAMNSEITVLGSQEWGVVDIPEERVDNRRLYYSESFYQDQKSIHVEKFREEYKDRFDIEPNRWAMIGYDTADFLFQTLERVENPALLKNALKEQPRYEGLISNIFFNGKHINQEVKIFRISGDGIYPVMY